MKHLKIILLKHLKTLKNGITSSHGLLDGGTVIASKRRSGAMERGMTADKRLGAVKSAVPEQLAWTTLHRLEELGGEW
jgi:hypothetical protein